MSVTAAIDALRHDAAVWDQVSQVTRRAGQEAGALSLHESLLSWASVPTGLLATYAQIQQKTVTLLDEATAVYREVSTALDKVAHAYELSDTNAASQLKGVWDVRE
ncbi:hypothetical protein [Paractinoplanes rishiriensis]|uniref:Excreted virulence factor EspC (Type VII ESX diderm) n=1 Tax=Paractinoplanes rishiriensis TaxID=1050105 RepID=A0A919MVM7_9ACTN|nr:hypothetical protein [Actinoplanes rishiriensis]GIF01587.1 hypothetical protein Ari01nite_90510 [Actinoplanes rishiriensis]